MMDEMKRIDEAAAKVLAVCGKADIGVILGSGLGDYAEALEDAVKLPYSEIPGTSFLAADTSRRASA